MLYILEGKDRANTEKKKIGRNLEKMFKEFF
jgi:hypothetical protein